MQEFYLLMYDTFGRYIYVSISVLFIACFVATSILLTMKIDYMPFGKKEYVLGLSFVVAIFISISAFFLQKEGLNIALATEYCLSEQYKDTDICVAAKVKFVEGRSHRFENYPSRKQINQMASIRIKQREITAEKAKTLAEQKRIEEIRQRIQKEEFLKNMHKIEIKE